MNKPKWLELIWLMCWMMPPVIVAAIMCQLFRMNFMAYIAVSIAALFAWLGLAIAWSWLTSSKTEDRLLMKVAHTCGID